MKKYMYVYFIISTLCLSNTYKFELGLASPMQLKSPLDSVQGVRISLIDTVNYNVKGLDLVLLASATIGRSEGLRIGGLMNHVENGGKIISIFNFLNSTKGESKFIGIINGININEVTEGVRLSLLLNYAKESKGFDLALVNISSSHAGTQVGLLNITKHLTGKQFGLINYAKNSKYFSILPFYNNAN